MPSTMLFGKREWELGIREQAHETEGRHQAK